MIVLQLWSPCYPTWLTSRDLSFYIVVRLDGDLAIDDEVGVVCRID